MHLHMQIWNDLRLLWRIGVVCRVTVVILYCFVKNKIKYFHFLHSKILFITKLLLWTKSFCAINTENIRFNFQKCKKYCWASNGIFFMYYVCKLNALPHPPPLPWSFSGSNSGWWLLLAGSARRCLGEWQLKSLRNNTVYCLPSAVKLLSSVYIKVRTV